MICGGYITNQQGSCTLNALKEGERTASIGCGPFFFCCWPFAAEKNDPKKLCSSFFGSTSRSWDLGMDIVSLNCQGSDYVAKVECIRMTPFGASRGGRVDTM